VLEEMGKREDDDRNGDKDDVSGLQDGGAERRGT
jgi:hypothetical protein